LAVAVAALLVFVAAVFAWSGVSLAGDPTALARVKIEPLGGTLERVRAFGPDGRRIPLVVRDARLTPRTFLSPGEAVSVDAVIRRPGWLGWAFGKERHEQWTVHAPVADVSERWLTVRSGSAVRIRFDEPVTAAAVGSPGRLKSVSLRGAQSSLVLPHRSSTGTVEVAAAARAWERLGPRVTVSWFPPAPVPVAVVQPGPGARLAPASPIRLTFSEPVSKVLGNARPRLTPRTSGRWRVTDDHTLVFTPSGFGARFDSKLRLDLGRRVAVTRSSGNGLRTTGELRWTIPAGSVLRLQQLLAQAGYLPVEWTPSGQPVARTPRGELQAAIDPPRGHFTWRYPNTPHELRALFHEGSFDQITRGAVMMFQDNHRLTVDAIPGAMVWHALLKDAIAARRRDSGYSYVYVHSKLPQSLTLWHNGQTILTSPGNTGVPAAPTKLGTFPVFEHIPVGTMSGTNPDGSHYHDPGIRWISYFNGGEAIHAFNRASFGTPQSLGCVELPLPSAAKVWPYTPIGTLVTVEK
jgi:peptidoglycan hydrolase-like protein with peptidoglycan-binding domain